MSRLICVSYVGIMHYGVLEVHSKHSTIYCVHFVEVGELWNIALCINRRASIKTYDNDKRSKKTCTNELKLVYNGLRGKIQTTVTIFNAMRYASAFH